MYADGLVSQTALPKEVGDFSLSKSACESQENIDAASPNQPVESASA